MTVVDSLAADVEKVRRLSIVPTILDVVCEITGMRFAAVARVTDTRWIACSVRDDINFGLKSGDELKIETTICNEIRDNRRAVAIDNVSQDPAYCDHHTPKIYGLQSYISYPIVLKDGEFFGTLCAIDSAPSEVKNPRVLGMFGMFAELISHHLQIEDASDKNKNLLHDVNTRLADSLDENRQYQHLSNHNLQEPLRKIKVFSNLLVDAAKRGDVGKTVELSSKVSDTALVLSMMIQDLSSFSELNYPEKGFEKIDLNEVIKNVCEQLKPVLESRGATVEYASLPALRGVVIQIEQLFYHLINNALLYAKPTVPPFIKITAGDIPADQIGNFAKSEDMKFVRITVEDNGIGIEKSQLEKIFDIFSQVPQTPEGFGFGLAFCRKIVRKHGGVISAKSEQGVGSTFSIVLPVEN